MPENDDQQQTETDVSEQLAAALKDVEKWKTLSRQNEARAKSNADKAERFDEIEEANKTETQRLTDELEKARKQIAERDQADERQKLIQEIAESKGVDVRALRGSTREELEEHADLIKSLIPDLPAAPSAEGQGNVGDVIGDDDLSAEDIVAAATK